MSENQNDDCGEPRCAKRCRKPQNRRATLEAQKQIKALEAKRNTKRRQLFDAQDDVDKKRAELIEEIERQLQTKTSIEPVFTLRWTLGDGAGTTA